MDDEQFLQKIAAKCNVSADVVQEYCERCSFSEFMDLCEATADKNPWLTTGMASNNVTAAQPLDLPEPDKTDAKTDAKSTIDASGNKAKVSKEINPFLKIKQEFDDHVIADTPAGEMDIPKSDIAKRGDKAIIKPGSPSSTNYSRKMNSTLSTSSLSADFRRGANTFNSLASESTVNEVSIVGNTADSHKPTVQLRKLERIKRDRANRKRNENKNYVAEPVVKKPFDAQSAHSQISKFGSEE